MSNMLDANALAQTTRPLKTFFDRLAGPDGSQWMEAFKRFLRRENPWLECAVSAPTSPFPSFVRR